MYVFSSFLTEKIIIFRYHIDDDKDPSKKVAVYNLVRTDSRTTTLDTFVRRPDDDTEADVVREDRPSSSSASTTEAMEVDEDSL